MGGYLLLFPTVRVYCLVFLGFFITSIGLPAWMMLIYWLAIQLLTGVASAGENVGGVAFWAHVGGFVTGMVLVKLFTDSEALAAHRGGQWRPSRLAGR